MELPAEVLIHNTQLGMKGGHGRLLRIAGEGYYEINVSFGEKVHRAVMPISSTVLICKDAEQPAESRVEIER